MEAAHSPKRPVRMASQLAMTTAPAETVRAAISAAASRVLRKKPLGRWFYPMAKYLFCGVTLLVLILGAVLGGIG